MRRRALRLWMATIWIAGDQRGRSPSSVVAALLRRGVDVTMHPLLRRMLPPRARIWLRFCRQQRRPPRLWHPDTLTDMIARVMLLPCDPLVTRTTDKVSARAWIAEKVGERHLPVLHQVANSFDEVDLDRLPQSVVIKASHGSGMTLIVTGGGDAVTSAYVDTRVVTFDGPTTGLDHEEVRSLTQRWLDTDYSNVCGERHYEGIERRLIVEEYLGTSVSSLLEFSIYCVKGNVVYCEICPEPEREFQVDRHYRQLDVLDFRGVPASGALPAQPDYFDEMCCIAEQLSSDFDCARVDFYRAGDRTIVSEITHTTNAGYIKFDPPDFDRVFGRFWNGNPTIPERFFTRAPDGSEAGP